MSVRNLLLLAVGALVIGGLAFVMLRDDPVPVDLAEVLRGPMEVTINADGRTQVRNLYEISSPIAGTALRSPVSVGDPVTEGETVVAVVQPVASALLDERSRRQAEANLHEAQGAMQLAETERASAEEDLTFARTQYERARSLVERGAATVARLEGAEQRLAISEAAIRAADARIALARATLERAEAGLMTPAGNGESPDACCIRITAPASGIVLSVDTISQRPVAPGSPLLTIGDPSDLELVADILSSDGVRLQAGAHAHVERWGGEGVLEARLDRIAPVARTRVSTLGIEEQRVDVYLSLDTPEEERAGLGEGFSVFLRIVEWRGEDVLQIPVSALFRKGDLWAVFVARDGIAEERSVVIGHRNNRVAEVLDGLEEGSRVVLHPSDRVAAGVTLVERMEL